MILTSGNGKKLLIDCGSDINKSLPELYQVSDIDAIYISHLHGDHMGGLEWFGFYNYFANNKRVINLYAHESIADRLWEALKVTMEVIHLSKKNIMSDYFNVIKVKDSFVFDDIDLKLIKVPHIHSLPKEDTVYSYGLFIRDIECIITSYITTDMSLWKDPKDVNSIGLLEYKRAMERANLVFHDGYPGTGVDVHPALSDLAKYGDEFKHKMLIYHCETSEKNEKMVKDLGFAGLMKKNTLLVFNNSGKVIITQG